MAARLRVAFDATPLFGPRTGVGVFTHEVLARLGASSDLEVIAYAATWRGRGQLAELVPDGVRAVQRPMAARPLRAAWSRLGAPPVEWWTGPVDVVHGPNYVVPPTRGAALVSVHDLTPVRYPELCTRDTLAFPGLIQAAVDRGAWVHTGSEFVADEIRAHFRVDPGRVVAIHDGLTPLSPADPARGRALAGGDRYVLALGTVEPRKDLPSLVHAFDAVAGGDLEVRLVVAGPDGWGADAFRDAVAAAAHKDRIVRLDWVDDPDRDALVHGATAFAYPSRYEGFGFPPLEAMSAGVPVVATTAGSLPEVLGDAAVLVPVGDVAALAGAIERLLSDEAARDRCRAAGSERAQRYSWDDAVGRLIELYRRVLHSDR
ncbi:MAG: glycosyltransferase family 4 protein [Acidimicrobiales bacterium]|nr:glycosyltransferase family 4 protein [Acidimicrobiales bacterium]